MYKRQELGVTFDAIYSGFLGSAGQIGLIEDFYRQFRREGTLVLVDPVMGDHGKPYRTYTPVSYTHLDVYKRQVFLVSSGS